MRRLGRMVTLLDGNGERLAPWRVRAGMVATKVRYEHDTRYLEVTMEQPEKIDHPAHYGGDTTYEAIKVIEAWGLGFCLGNAVKYICRAGHKGDELEDLKKASWFLNREIDRQIARRRDQHTPNVVVDQRPSLHGTPLQVHPK